MFFLNEEIKILEGYVKNIDINDINFLKIIKTQKKFVAFLLLKKLKNEYFEIKEATQFFNSYFMTWFYINKLKNLGFLNIQQNSKKRIFVNDRILDFKDYILNSIKEEMKNDSL